MLVEFDNTIALGIRDRIGENSSTFRFVVGLAEQAGEIMTVENIVAEHQRRRRFAEEVLADQERLRQPIR